jgi:sugar phosphate isomerase/epimerase
MSLKIIYYSAIAMVLFLYVGCKEKVQPEKEPSFRNQIGLQLYSLRNHTVNNLDSALQFVKDQGITDVELAGFANLAPEQFKQKLQSYGLKPSSGLFGFEEFRDSIDKMIAIGKLFDISFMGCAWIPHKGDTITLAEIQEAVRVFNMAGQKLSENGIQFFYHNHGYEYVPFEDGTLFDYLYENTDSNNVKFELDIFWTKHGGQDPIASLKKYGKRIPLMHIKDMDKSVVGNLTGREDIENDVPWGTGQIDIKACLLLGKELGIKHFYLEDESTNVMTQIPISLKFTEDF